jgi:hypothetical protein
MACMTVMSHFHQSPLRVGWLQAIEFWSTLAEIELMYREEDEDNGVTSGAGTAAECKHFLDRCTTDLLPLLLELLLTQEEGQDDSDTEWCAAPASDGCLAVCAPWCRSCCWFDGCAGSGDAPRCGLRSRVRERSGSCMRDAAAGYLVAACGLAVLVCVMSSSWQPARALQEQVHVGDRVPHQRVALRARQRLRPHASLHPRQRGQARGAGGLAAARGGAHCLWLPC